MKISTVSLCKTGNNVEPALRPLSYSDEVVHIPKQICKKQLTYKEYVTIGVSWPYYKPLISTEADELPMKLRLAA